MLNVGENAPDFELMTDDGAKFRLSAEWKKGPLVVYFYPKDHTAGCTMQACSFRDAGEELAESGARVVGISSDSAEQHRSFRAKHDLDFVLLSDPSGSVARQFGVKKTLGLLPGRATFVIDARGRIALAFSSQLQPKLHVEKALEVLSRLSVG